MASPMDKLCQITSAIATAMFVCTGIFFMLPGQGSRIDIGWLYSNTLSDWMENTLLAVLFVQAIASAKSGEWIFGKEEEGFNVAIPALLIWASFFCSKHPALFFAFFAGILLLCLLCYSRTGKKLMNERCPHVVKNLFKEEQTEGSQTNGSQTNGSINGTPNALNGKPKKDAFFLLLHGVGGGLTVTCLKGYAFGLIAAAVPLLSVLYVFVSGLKKQKIPARPNAAAATADEELKQLKKEKAKLQQELAANKQALENSTRTARQQLDGLKRENAELRKNLDEKEKALKAAQNDPTAADLKKRVEELEHLAAAKDDEAKKLEKAAAEQGRTIADLRSSRKQLEEQAANYQQAQKDLAQLQELSKQQEVELKRALDERSKSEEAARKTAHELQSKASEGDAEAKKEAERLREELTALKDELHAAQEHEKAAVELKRENRELHDTIADNERAFRRLSELLERLGADQEREKHENSELHDTIADKERVIKDLRQRNDDLRTRNNKLMESIRTLEDALKASLSHKSPSS
ncbi:hypothetical protein M3Y99_01988800 [Aphelenchoides fujianensis]|nr:hypothetical protein M3Y99_01988800 [Aphelenchoides fujianensis]